MRTYHTSLGVHIRFTWPGWPRKDITDNNRTGNGTKVSRTASCHSVRWRIPQPTLALPPPAESQAAGQPAPKGGTRLPAHRWWWSGPGRRWLYQSPTYKAPACHSRKRKHNIVPAAVVGNLKIRPSSWSHCQANHSRRSGLLCPIPKRQNAVLPISPTT